MKTIKLKQKTAERLTSCDEKIQIIEATKKTMILTILYENDIDLSKYKAKYDNGEIILEDIIKEDNPK